MTTRVVRVPVYWLIIGLFMMIGSPILSVLAATNIAKNNANQIIAEADRQRTAAREESRLASCAFFASSLDIYQAEPPTTDLGKRLQRNYLDLYRITSCQPPRTK